MKPFKINNETNIEPRLKARLLMGEKISTLDGLKLFGTVRLSEYIRVLREKGHNIHTEMKKNPSTGKWFGLYYMPEKSRKDKTLTKIYKSYARKKKVTKNK